MPSTIKHISDRDQGYVYVTCNDYTHNNHLLAQYRTINNGNGPVRNLSPGQGNDVNACS